MPVDHNHDIDVRGTRVLGACDDIPEVAHNILEIVEVGVEDFVEKCAKLGVVVTLHNQSFVVAVAGKPRAQGRLANIEAVAWSVRRAGVAGAEDHEDVEK